MYRSINRSMSFHACLAVFVSYIYIYIYIYVCIYIYIYICIYMSVCVCACVRVCIYIYIYIYKHIPPHTHIYRYLNATTYIRECGINHYQCILNFLRHSSAANSFNGRCNLCLDEKISIINFKNRKLLLNKRNELVFKCRHRGKFKLS